MQSEQFQNMQSTRAAGGVCKPRPGKAAPEPIRSFGQSRRAKLSSTLEFLVLLGTEFQPHSSTANRDCVINRLSRFESRESTAMLRELDDL